MSWRNPLARLHRLVGRSEAAARLAVKVRNQANAIVCAHFSGFDDPGENGEYALVDCADALRQRFRDVPGLRVLHAAMADYRGTVDFGLRITRRC